MACAAEPDRRKYTRGDWTCPPKRTTSTHPKQNVFCPSAFRHFAPLLRDCEDYARSSGCRFSREPFRAALDGEVDARALNPTAMLHVTEPSLAAVLRAAPAVSKFAARLLAGEPALLEELDRSHRIVTAESVRNAIIAGLSQLEMWPPTKTFADVADDDCSYEDVSAPIPVIARRLWNDEQRRGRLAKSSGGVCVLRQRAMTAFFIVDFAEQIGTPLPAMRDTESMMLKELAARAAEWERETAGPEEGRGEGTESPSSARGSTRETWWARNSGNFLRMAVEGVRAQPGVAVPRFIVRVALDAGMALAVPGPGQRVQPPADAARRAPDAPSANSPIHRQGVPPFHERRERCGSQENLGEPWVGPQALHGPEQAAVAA